MREVGAFLETLLFMVQGAVLLIAGYAGKEYFRMAADPVVSAWALPRLLLSLLLVNAVMLFWLVRILRRLRHNGKIYVATKDGRLRELR